MNLPFKLVEYRKSQKLSQEELAAQLGVSRQSVSKWEQGRSCPDIAILDEIADALGISLFELLGMDERTQSSS